jgi:hypothetical protein
MIKRMRSGWYVVASVDHWRNYLCGPFQTQRAAVDMIEPVRRCAQLSDDPRFKQAQYGVTKKQASREGLPPGSLKLDHNYVRETLAVRSWASVFSDKRRTAGGWVDN